ncbi:MAG TPA: hypothetical protein VGR87_10745 [Candidatus Limnocylindria bacterium]|jgi:hypothetical protein|nr:hypothetical protein [Candidatus Limnocylindria bacterium]
MTSDSGFSAGLAIGALLLVLVVVLFLTMVPVGNEARPLIDIKFR